MHQDCIKVQVDRHRHSLHTLHVHALERIASMPFVPCLCFKTAHDSDSMVGLDPFATAS